EARKLVEEGRKRAYEIITGKRKVLDALAAELERKEVLDGEEVLAIIHRQDTGDSDSASTPRDAS
ncbi:MAG TPA: hypothetical protein ENK05_01445, partial [Gammaproteobacteria bacterium]|nr:hypothetical protein [Gammaproteobacteria bacterium]